MQKKPQLRTVLKGEETGRVDRDEARAAITRIRAAKEAALIAKRQRKRKRRGAASADEKRGSSRDVAAS
jgi:hypothetical protein